MRLAADHRRGCKAAAPSWTRRTRSANRFATTPTDRHSMSAKTEKLHRIAERPAGHPGAEDRRRRQCRAAGPRAGARRPAGDRDHHAHAGRAGGDPPRRGGGSRGGGRRRHHPQRRAVRARRPRPARNSSSARAPPARSSRRRATATVPLLPGAITPSEIMAALEEGLDFLKFFPAEQAGGAAFLKSLASPFAGVALLPDRRRHREERRRTICRCPT